MSMWNSVGKEQHTEDNNIYRPCRFQEQCNRKCLEVTEINNGTGISKVINTRFDDVMPCCTLAAGKHPFTNTYQWHLEHTIAKYGLKAAENCDYYGKIGLMVAQRWIPGYVPRETSELTNKKVEKNINKKNVFLKVREII